MGYGRNRKVGKPMKAILEYKIHYDNNDYQDEIIITGNTIEEVREKANKECEKRNWNTEMCWSEKL